MSLDPRLELLEPVGDPLTQRYQARFAGKAANVWIATAATPMVVRAQMAALARADLPRVLRSPYLGRVLHGGTNEEGLPYLVIESVDAVTLQARMVEGPAFKVPDAVRMVVDLLGGIDALAKLGLHHGAVEPSHIRVIDASRGSTLRLFQLGANTRGARTGQIDPDGVTTAAALAYAAPEQARGDLGSDVSADAFSTVAVLYALLGGHLPFGGAHAEGVLSEAAYGSPRPLGEIRPELAGPLSDAIARALASDVTARFDSIAELQRALRGALLRSPGLRSLMTVVGEREGIVEATPRPARSSPPHDAEPPDDAGPLDAESPQDPESLHDEAFADGTRGSRDEFGLDDAFDETFGADDAPGAEATESDDRVEFDAAFADAKEDEGWLDDVDDAPLELRPPSAADDGGETDQANEEERTRVGQVSPDVLAALGSGEYAEPSYDDYPDYADDEEDEPTRVGAVRQDLIAQTIREDDKPTLPPDAHPDGVDPEPRDSDPSLRETPVPDAPVVESLLARSEADGAPDEPPAVDAPAEPRLERPSGALTPEAPAARATSSVRPSERPAGALPTAPGTPSTLSSPAAPEPTESPESSGSGWVWMLVGMLVLAAAVAAGMLYGS